MSVKLETIEKNVRKLTIEVEAEKFENALERSYKKNVKKFEIQGFRKGKAPRNIIERTYGEGAFYEDAIGFVYPEAYDLAVKEVGIDPVEYPKIDIEDIGSGKNLVFTATVTVKPEVELGEYLGVEAEKNDAKVEESQVDEEIEKERQSNARITKIEDRPVDSGDVCVIDYEGLLDGVPFEGGTAQGHELTIGSNQFIPGFEDQLIGVEVGELVELNVTFPDEYHQPDLAGKPVVFKVTVNELKEKKLPELNDEFAQEVSEFDTLEEYKNSIRENLQKKADEEAEVAFENSVLEKVGEKSSVEIPEVMINNRVEDMIKELESSLSRQGLNLDLYLQLTGMDQGKLKDEFRDRAENEVKVSLIIEAIAKKEELTVSDEDLEAKIKEMAENYNKTYEEIKELIGEPQQEAIRDNLVFKKAVDLVVGNAKAV